MNLTLISAPIMDSGCISLNIPPLTRKGVSRLTNDILPTTLTGVGAPIRLYGEGARFLKSKEV